MPGLLQHSELNTVIVNVDSVTRQLLPDLLRVQAFFSFVYVLCPRNFSFVVCVFNIVYFLKAECVGFSFIKKILLCYLVCSSELFSCRYEHL